MARAAIDTSPTMLALLVSSVTLGYAIQTSNGQFSQEAFSWAAVSFAFSLAPALLPRMSSIESIVSRRLLLPAFVASLAFQFAVLASSSPGLYLDPATGYTLPEFQSLIALSAVLSGLALARTGRDRRMLTPLLLVLYGVTGLWMLKASPNPHIDVFSIHQDSLAALLHGTDPYTLTFPNPYHATQWFSPGAATYDRLLFGYVYPAWTLLLALPGYILAHDYRYSFLAAVVLSATLAAYARPRGWALAAVLVFLFTPRGFFVLEQGWTEPALLVGVAISVFAASRRHLRWLLPLGLGIVACAKQYSILAAPAVLLLFPMFPSLRAFAMMILKALAFAAVLTLPLALRHPKAYWYDVFGMQFSAPFRTDALSIPVFWLNKFGKEMPKSLQLGAPVVLAVLAMLRASRTASGFAWAGGTIYFIFFMFRHGFGNYYYLVIGVYAFAMAVAQPGPSRLERAG